MFELLFKYPLTVYEKGSFVLQSGWSLWWWVLASAAAAGVVGWLLLRQWNNGKRARALVLWGLQSTMIALVLLLLWQPGISIATLKPQQNIVAVLLDDSRSMALTEDGLTRRVVRPRRRERCARGVAVQRPQRGAGSDVRPSRDHHGGAARPGQPSGQVDRPGWPAQPRVRCQSLQAVRLAFEGSSHPLQAAPGIPDLPVSCPAGGDTKSDQYQPHQEDGASLPGPTARRCP